MAANSPRFFTASRHSPRRVNNLRSASRPSLPLAVAATKSATTPASVPDRVTFMQNARRSSSSFSPSLNMKHTVLSRGPSIAGLTRRPVLTLGLAALTCSVSAMPIAKHICLMFASGFPQEKSRTRRNPARSADSTSKLPDSARPESNQCDHCAGSLLRDHCGHRSGG